MQRKAQNKKQGLNSQEGKSKSFDSIQFSRKQTHLKKDLFAILLSLTIDVEKKFLWERSAKWK